MATENYSDESEREVIGAALSNPRYAEIAISQLQSEMIYNKRNRVIFEAIKAVYDTGAVVSSSSVISILRDRDLLATAGNETYISTVARDVIALSATQHHIDEIIAKSNLRRLKVIISDLYRKIDTTADSAESVVEEIRGEIENIKFNSKSDKSFKKSEDVVSDVLTKIKDLRDGKVKSNGIKTRFANLDAITNGFQRGDLVILAARPSMGKTAFSLNIATDAAIDSNEEGAIVFFSLEMPAEHLFLRILSAQSMVEGGKLRTGSGITTQDWAKITAAANKLRTLDIYIDDTPGLTLPVIQSKLRTLSRTTKLKMVILDYLQIVTTPGKNLVQEYGMLSRNFKLLARDLNVCFVSLAQLSRAVEKRENKRPIMSDLRDSGSIEQDADLIMFLYREAYYTRTEEDMQAVASVAELILAKHRNGSTGTVNLTFANKFGSFENRND